MNKLYRFLYPILSPFFRFLYRIQITGAENEPTDENGFLVCANHLSNRDVVILAASLRHQVCFLAKKELFRVPILSSIIRALGAFPIDRKTADVGALKKSLSLLESNHVIAVYPQGTRKRGIDPRTTEPKSGVGFIVARAGCRVLPVSIQTKGYKIIPFRKTYVTIGKPILPEEMAVEGRNSAEYVRVSQMIFSRILGQMREDESL